MCQMESSGKWPDEVEAIQQIKAAFYVKMSELLSKDHSLISSPTFGHLDVLKVRITQQQAPCLVSTFVLGWICI